MRNVTAPQGPADATLPDVATAALVEPSGRAAIGAPLAATPGAGARVGTLRRRWRHVALALALFVLPFVPGLDSDSGRSLLTQMAIAAVFALSFNLLFGETGLLSFGHAVYFGLGGYAAIALMHAINHGLPLPMVLVPLAGAAAGLVAGVLFGAISTRRGGTVFALISLGLGELVYAATFMLPSVFGGEEGLTASRTRAPADFGVSLASQLTVYEVVVAWALFAAVLMYGFTRTPLGRVCNAVRDNAERVEFVGYSAPQVRLAAVAVAGLFAGLAGGLSALNYEIVAAEAVGAQRSGLVLIMAYIGGTAHFLGPVLGAVVITWLQTSLSAYTPAWLLYLGVFFILVIRHAPRGLAGLVAQLAPVLRAARPGPMLRAAGIAAVPLAAGAVAAVLLIEMSYRVSTQAELGTRMQVLGIRVDAASPWSWTLALLALGGAIVLLHLVRPRVALAWRAPDAGASA